MRKHLVLGSEGQVGQYVCDEIERNGDEVIRWDIALGERYDLADDWYVASSLDAGRDPSLNKRMEQCDFVHFLAYNVGGAKYLAAKQNSYEYIEENVAIMQNTFDALKESGKPFYFASSQMSNMTDSVYGQLKAIGESYTKALGGLNIKFWNVYGYESDPEKTHVITDFIKSALTEGRILCRTDGQEERHFTHAKDAADMLFKLSNPKNYDVAVTWPDPVPIVKDPVEGWVTIAEVAATIAELIPGTEVYFGTKKDTTQTVKNLVRGDAKLNALLNPFPVKPQQTYNTSNPLMIVEGVIKDSFGRTIQVGTTSSVSSGNFFDRGILLKDGIADMIERIKNDGVL